MESQPKTQTKSSKKGKKRRWDPAVTAAEQARENQKVKKGRKDETERGWMKNIKWITNMGIKWWRLGMNALQEIRFYQKITVLLIPMKVFYQLIRENGQCIKVNIRWQSTAICALQNGAKDYMVRLFDDANLCVIHAQRQMIMPWDKQLTQRIVVNITRI